MESESSYLYPRRRDPAVESRFDLYLGFEEVDGGDEESTTEFMCPFCSEDYDIVGLCCHIDDEHPGQGKSAVCPVCSVRVGLDMAGHITSQHANIFKMQHDKRYHKDSLGVRSSAKLMKKELQDGYLHTLLGGSRYATPPSSASPDPLLSSFICSFLPDVTSDDIKSQPLNQDNSLTCSLDEKVVDSVEKLPLSEKDQEKQIKDQEERTRRSRFVQELLLSTVFRNNFL